MNIDNIRDLCTDANIEVTAHMLQRMIQRHITYSDLKQVVMNGDIIECYSDDYPYPSCLVLGYTVNGRVLHAVVGEGEGRLWFITAYDPDPEQWSADFRRRKDLL